MTDLSVEDKNKQVLRAFIAERHGEQVEMLRRLVQVPSDNPPGDCAAHAETAAALFEALGFEIERHPVPAALVSAVGMKSATNLVVRERFGPGPVVALNAHGDVVPPGEGWTTDPYGGEVREGWMYGRGVATSKSDFTSYAFALLALRRVAGALRGSVEIHLTYDEETGGEIGPKWLLDEKISKPDYAICAGFSYGVVTAHNGCLHLEVEILGKSAHAAMPDTGIDALEAANEVLSALYAARRTLAGQVSAIAGIGHPNMVIGKIEGGINTNVVPDKVTFRIDRRLIPEENGEQVYQTLAGEIRRVALAAGARACEVRKVLLAEPLAPLPGHETVTGALTANASAILGEPVVGHGVPLYTDARHYCIAGIPTVLYGAGPRTILEANAHRADERLKLSDLEKATEIVACAVYDMLRVKQ